MQVHVEVSRSGDDAALLRRRRLFAQAEAALAEFMETEHPAARRAFIRAIEAIRSSMWFGGRQNRAYIALRSAFGRYAAHRARDRAESARQLRQRLEAFGRATGAAVPDDVAALVGS